jgi:hypothetical protein
MRCRGRTLIMLAIIRFMRAFILLGHIIVQLLGAVDAYVTALLGVPRLAVLGGRVRAALRETWEA